MDGLTLFITTEKEKPMSNYINPHNLPLPLIMFLMRDEYVKRGDYSATELLNGTRRIILTNRIARQEKAERADIVQKIKEGKLPKKHLETLVSTLPPVDIANNVHAALGNAIHTYAENMWKDPEIMRKALAFLGYPESMADKIRINPKRNKKGTIPVFVEHPLLFEFNGFNISGTLDLYFNGVLYDYKSTKTYAYSSEAKERDYRMQGSIYRVGACNKMIQPSHLEILFLFKDFKAFMTGDNYPPAPTCNKVIELMPEDETLDWLEVKTNELREYDHDDIEIHDMPLCTAEELQQNAPEFKYYKSLDQSRASKTGTLDELREYKLSQGGVGHIKKIVEEPFACRYCPLNERCDQRSNILGNLETFID